ncbi:Bor/Iss family lipoprotein [Calditrichota bacterium]
MLKKIISIILVFSIIFLTGCYAVNHTVGEGAKGNTTVTERQWYVLFGLVPINEVNSKAMADGATDYEIKTEMTFVDVVIGIFTGLVSIQPTTVTVKK